MPTMNAFYESGVHEIKNIPKYIYKCSVTKIRFILIFYFLYVSSIN